MKDEAKKVSKNRQKKEALVAELADKVAKAKAMVFANYQGMTHVQLEQLKKALKPFMAEVVIAKNTLLAKALENQNAKIKDQNLQGPTATMFAYEDAVLPIKEIAKSIKTLKLPVIKFGIMEGNLLAEADVVRLSTLPSREVLIAQVVGGMKSPIYGLHHALNWNLQKLVLTLNAIQKTKTSIV